MIQQNTPEWLEMRRNYIGASDAPIIMGVSPWKTEHQLWEEKLGLRESQYTNAAMQRGHEFEPIALAAYNAYTGKNASPQVVFHEERKYMMASLDGLSQDGSTVLEIKCPGKKDHDIAASGKVPEKYYPQLQHQLATIQLNIVHYFSYLNGEFHLVEVPRDDEYIEKLFCREEAFWKKVQKWEEPALTDRDYVQREDSDWTMKVHEWEKAKIVLQKAKVREEDIKKELIKMANGHSTCGAGVKLQKIIRKGSVDYNKIPELKGIDLDKYRKESFQMWRLS